MTKKQTDHIQVKFDLVRAMLPHVPFDGWSLEALEQGAIDIGFEKKGTTRGFVSSEKVCSELHYIFKVKNLLILN